MDHQKQKAEFLDSLQPDDLRNPASFNLITEIIEEIFSAAKHKNDPQEFVVKAASNLFRERSEMVEKMVKLFVFCDEESEQV